MKTLKDAIGIIMAQPPELHYPAYYADLLREADVPDKDDGKCSEIPNNSGKDTIYRQDAIDAVKRNTFRLTFAEEQNYEGHVAWSAEAVYSDVMEGALLEFPSAQLGQRYTNEELRVFQHGISLSLLSKRSSQHWQYDENTATEIKFLERLYEKVSANMRGGQNE